MSKMPAFNHIEYASPILNTSSTPKSDDLKEKILEISRAIQEADGLRTHISRELRIQSIVAKDVRSTLISRKNALMAQAVCHNYVSSPHPAQITPQASLTRHIQSSKELINHLNTKSSVKRADYMIELLTYKTYRQEALIHKVRLPVQLLFTLLTTLG